MSNRLEVFINELREEMTDVEIAAGLGNGDIQAPDWLHTSESTDHVKVWDEDGGSPQWGFISLDYGYDD